MTQSRRALARPLFLAALVAASACAGSHGPSEGAIAWFAFDGHPLDTLQVHLTRPGAIDSVERVLAGTLPRMFPAGWIRPGPGVDPRFPFHFVPDSVGLAQFAIEVCDGAPMRTPEQVATFMAGSIRSPDGTAAQWCPWGAYPAKIQRL